MLTEEDYFKTISDEGISNEAIDKYNKGEELRRQKKYQDALIYYNQAIDISEKYVKAYLGKYYTLDNLLKHDEKVSYIKEIITSLNKCILFGPLLSAPLNMKGEFYLSRHQISSAIHCFKMALLIAPKEVLYICKIAQCYSMIYNFSKAEKYYKKAISFLPEYSNEVMETMKKLFKIDKIPSKIKTWHNGNYCETTYFESDIHAEISDMYGEMKYYSKSLAELNKAIDSSNWSEYYLKKIVIYKNIAKKRNVEKYNDKIIENLIIYYKFHLCVEDNKHTMLYTIIKSRDSINKDINWEMFPLLFWEYPQSILDIFKINATHDNISQCYDIVSQIEDFSMLMNYFDSIYDKYSSTKKKVILYYFLGGIASSYYLFDEELDNEQEYDNLSSMEMYYFSKVAKMVDIDFNQIINANITNLKYKNKNNIDYYYLGLIYLLKEDTISARACFEKSQKNIYSMVMLSFLDKDFNAVKDINVLDFKIIDNHIDINVGLSQFYKYFHIIECGEAIEYYCYFNDNEIRDLIYKPIWEVFSLSDSYKGVILEKLKWTSIERILETLITNDLYSGNKDELNYLISEIDRYNNTVIAISNCCKEKDIKEKNILELTRYYYLSHKIDLDDFITLNLYYINIVQNKRNSNVTKAIVYGLISSFSLWANFWGAIMDILFYILDNNIGIFKTKEIDYHKYRVRIKPFLLDDWHYITIKKLLKKSTPNILT